MESKLTRKDINFIAPLIKVNIISQGTYKGIESQLSDKSIQNKAGQ